MTQQRASTNGDGRERASGTTGRAYWRSLDELADTASFKEFVHREFPAGASEMLDPATRRTFLQLMGASLALAGAATIPGCRRPDHKIMPYSRQAPEEIIPGKPLYYATSMPLPGGSGAEGLLVETHEGRPTKIEGNPLHPVNQGKSSVWAQASILGMYDPDRRKFPIYRGEGEPRQATWDDFAAWSGHHFTKHDKTGGADLAFVVEKKSSPTRDAVRDRVLARWPMARWIAYDAAESPAPGEGSRIAFGSPMREVLTLAKARVIVSLDRDFLQGEGGSLVHAREFASTRRTKTTHDEMSRLYVAECGMSLTGGQADHRLRIAPSRLPGFAVELARAVLKRLKPPAAKALADALDHAASGDEHAPNKDWIEVTADDLVHHRGAGLIVAGDSLPAPIHALVHALNAALGNVGKTVAYRALSDENASDSAAGLAELASAIDAGEVTTLVCLGVNPVYDAPAELDFAAKYDAVETTISLDVDTNETGQASTWALDGAHYLESWGDVVAHDGTVSPIQPMIAPLYGSRSDIELLLTLLGEAEPDGHEAVRETWKANRGTWRADGGLSFEKWWRRVLHDGMLAGTASSSTPNPSWPAVTKAIEQLDTPGSDGRGGQGGRGGVDVVFATDTMYDGRFANYGWLQELPRDGTRMVWDNAALLSPATARRLGLLPAEDMEDTYTPKVPKGRMCRVTLGGRSVELAAWVLPGMADDTVILPLGYGRRVCGLVGSGVGFDVYPLRESSARRVAFGATVERISGKYPISSTQNHWTMEGRDSIVRSVDLPAWQAHGDELVEHNDELYATVGDDLNFGERLGELAHAPPNRSIYKNPLNDSYADAAEGSEAAVGHAWGMAIDLSTCTGCNVCTIACQSENNIPVVGKTEVRKGRELAWIRVDRYFSGDLENPEEMSHQPVACVQCENAPCETVCPVNATVHGPEGINAMVYNRCIGTRYCANNCPYKVRRFNFFDYGTAKYRGKFIGQGVFGRPENVNLIPPRLREKVSQLTRMRMNPDVTVRSRGVMEKCTYCVQRINHARWETKLMDLDRIPDGFFQTACQQACPSGAIVFGDLNQDSAVKREHEHGRAYMLLGFLNTRPRTRHQVRVRNPNPRLRKPVVDPFHHGGHEGSGPSEPHGEGGDGGGGGGGGGGHAGVFGVIPGRREADSGYALSLRVLGKGVVG